MKLSTSQLIIGGYMVALLLLGIVALLAYSSTREYVASVAERRAISLRIDRLSGFLSLLKDAETGQRGFLLTNDKQQLQYYSAASDRWEAEFEQLAAAYPNAKGADREALDRLRQLARAKMDELDKTIRLRQSTGDRSEQELKTIVEGGRGRELMSEIRGQVDELEKRERTSFDAVNARSTKVANTTLSAVTVLCPLAFGLIAGAFVLVQRDLDQRNEAEKALKQQRVLLSAIVNSMKEGVVVADEHGRLMHFNPSAERLLGRGAIEQGFERWTDEYGVYQSDKITPIPADQLPLVRAVRGESVEFTDMYIQPPGTEAGRFLAGTATPMVDEFGHNRGGIIIMRDVTATRAAERRFQSLLESAPDGLIIVNRHGVIELVNSQTERLFGYDAEHLIGQPVELLVPLAQRAGHPGMRDDFFKNPRIRNMGSGLELSGQRADGSLIPIEISLSPVDGGEELLVCAAIRDVTERRRVMDQIRQLNDELEDRVVARTAELATANQELVYRNQENEMFVYSVSHDLRSPLVNLQGFSQELDGACARLRALVDAPHVSSELRSGVVDIIDGDVKESIHFIRTSVSRLSGIIDALLRLSRAGRVVYHWQTVNVERIVARIIDSANGTIGQHRAEVLVQPLPAAAGDATAIDQIFANLIHNALHYLDAERPGRLEIGADRANSPAGMVTYYVRDNGVGIPRELQSKVFQAFQRLTPGLAAGEGMGLTLVQRIIERHGGRIWLESSPGEGSTFYFTLPDDTAGEPGGRDGVPLSLGASG